jgi:hypothetical protein
MKQTILLFFFLSFSLGFSIDFDLEEIALPYDNLDITDLSVTNKTIICRAENKIYRSEDDGVTWEIVFDAPKKINDYFELDHKTIFITGDKGMIYRTTDSGDNWLDISVDTDSNLTHVTAKNLNDYIVLAERKQVYHTKNGGLNWNNYNHDNYYYTFDVLYFNNKYIFGGGSGIIGTEYRNAHVYYLINTSLFTLENNILNEAGYAFHESESTKAESFFSFTKFFNSNDQLLIVSHKRLSSKYFNENTPYFTTNDTIVNIFEENDILSIFDLAGNYYELGYSEFLAWKSPYSKIDYSEKNIGIEKLNKIIKTDYGYAVGSDKSRIFKVKVKETESNIKTLTATPEIEVYPNPTTDVVNIHFSRMMQVESLEIYGITGNLVESNSYSDYTNNIIQKTDKLTTGVYFIKIITSNGVFHKKIVKF